LRGEIRTAAEAVLARTERLDHLEARVTEEFDETRAVIRLSRFCARHVAVAAALVFTLTSDPSRADQIAKLLQKEISPGSIVLLAPYSTDARVIERWEQALKSDNPGVRAAAARVINTCSVASRLSDVEQALRSETDLEAAREEIRAAVALGSRDDDLVFGAAARFGGRLDERMAMAIARSRGFAAVPLYFERFNSLRLGHFDIRSFFLIATRGNGQQLLAAGAMALGRGDQEAWAAILDAAAGIKTPPTSPVLLAALTSPESRLRGETAWYLARSYCEAPPADAKEALVRLRQGIESDRSQGQDPETSFGQELLRRVLGEAPIEDASWIACLRTETYCHLDASIGQSPLVKYLTPAEKAALEARRGKAVGGLPATGETQKASPGGPAAHTPPTQMWAVSDIPAAVSRDLLNDESCGRRNDRLFAATAEVRFGEDGRPRRVTINLLPQPIWDVTGGTATANRATRRMPIVMARQSGSCREFIESLFLICLAPADELVSEDKPIEMVTALTPGSIECAAEEENQPLVKGPSSLAATYFACGRIVAPKLTKKLEPNYPVSALWSRVEGTVILEALIGRNGCIERLHVLRGLTEEMNVASVAAISQWKYEPAMLDGKPVRVFLTVTVNFRLHR
jgi:TonB family protein